MKNTIWYISKYANISLYGADTRQSIFCIQFAKKGHHVKLITSNSSHLYSDLPKFSGPYLDMQHRGVDVTWVNTIKYENPRSLKRILSWLLFEILVISMCFNRKYKKPDIVIASSLSLLSVLSGAFFKKFYKSKFIFEVRDIWPKTLIDIGNISPRNPLIWVLRKIEHFGYRYADRIVGTIPGLNIYVDEQVGLGSKVEYIPQGVDLHFYLNEQKKLPPEYQKKYIPNDKFLVTYTGSFGVANALEYIIDAAAILIQKDRNSNVHFLLVGDGASKKSLVLRAQNLKNITFAPVLNKDQVQNVLSMSDLLVSSVRDESLYNYGMSPNKFIDYMYSDYMYMY